MHQCLYRVYRSQHVTKWMSSICLFPYELLMSFRNADKTRSLVLYTLLKATRNGKKLKQGYEVNGDRTGDLDSHRRPRTNQLCFPCSLMSINTFEIPAMTFL